MNTTTETVQHTPTPYDAPLEIRQTPQGPRIVDSSGEPIAEAYTERGAEAIVRACNNHEALVAALKPFAALIDWADVSESDADDEAFLTGTRNDIESFCGAKTAVLTVGDLRRAKAAIATLTP